MPFTRAMPLTRPAPSGTANRAPGGTRRDLMTRLTPSIGPRGGRRVAGRCRVAYDTSLDTEDGSDSDDEEDEAAALDREIAALKRSASIMAASLASVQAGAQEAATKGHALTLWMGRRLGVDASRASLFPAQVEGVGGGWGMFTKREIKKGERLIGIPEKLLMTDATARASDACGDLIQNTMLTPWQSLILHLLCERALGSGSDWAEYIDMLPSQSDHPLLWSTELAEARLMGSPMLKKLRSRLEMVDEDMQALLDVGANNLLIAEVHRMALKTELVNQQSVRWAAATLLTRSFSLQIDNKDDMDAPWADDDAGANEAWNWAVSEPTVALVPWADMLNHSPEAGEESCLRWDSEKGGAVLFAHRDYSAGDEVFDSYGVNLSASDLLLDYGFVPPSCGRRQVEVFANDIVTPRSESNAALLAALNEIYGECVVILTDDGVDDTGLSYLRAAYASEQELARVGWAGTDASPDAALRAMGGLSEPRHTATEAALLEALAQAIDRALAGYSMSPEDNARGAEASGAPWLHVQVLRAIAAEQGALLGAQAVVAGWREALAHKVPLFKLYA